MLLGLLREFFREGGHLLGLLHHADEGCREVVLHLRQPPIELIEQTDQGLGLLLGIGFIDDTDENVEQYEEDQNDNGEEEDRGENSIDLHITDKVRIPG